MKQVSKSYYLTKVFLKRIPGKYAYRAIFHYARFYIWRVLKYLIPVIFITSRNRLTLVLDIIRLGPRHRGATVLNSLRYGMGHGIGNKYSVRYSIL